MSSRQSTVDFIVEHLTEAGDVSSKKMFGEYGIYCGETMVALVCDDQLFVKKTAAGQAFLGKCEEGPPYPGAKSCFIISGEKWENREWLSQLIRLSASELSLPKKKSGKPARPKTKLRG
jgi:TfoX/Sxy family transcriptional regulator of competence genes